MDQILQIVHQHGLYSQVTVSQNTFSLCDKKPDAEVNVMNIERFQISIPKTVSSNKVKELSTSINNLKKNIQISHKLGINEKMPDYKGFHKVFSEESADLVHKAGEVILVDVWATWCGPCQRPMQHNQEMLEKNSEKWKEKVRIVAVSVDEDKQVIKTRVNGKGWTRIEHLTLLGWDNTHPLISDFEIQGIPFVFLVDKQGKINFVGHPSQINLEERINQLIESQVQAKVETHQEIKEITQEVKKEIKLKQGFKKLLSKQALDAKFGQVQLFQSFGTISSTINRGRVENTPSKFKVSSYEDQPELIKQFRTFFKDVDPNVYQIEENLVKFTNVPQTNNSSCVDCKKGLAFPFYWCRWDANPNNFRCRECVEKPSQEEGLHYGYGQNSVLLGGPCKRIALKGLGNNIQPQKQEISKLHPHGFGCNGGCGSGPENNGQARYVCLGCRNDPNFRGDYIDICSSCFKGYFEGEEGPREALQGDGHKKEHPLLRILYNVKGYYEF